MVEAEMLAGMAFNNANLGYVHAMAHQLVVNTMSHGVCQHCCRPRLKSTIDCLPRSVAELARSWDTTRWLDHHASCRKVNRRYGEMQGCRYSIIYQGNRC